MGYGTREEKIYFSVDTDTGKLSKWNNDKTVTLYDYVEGDLIFMADKKIKLDDGNEMHKLVLNLRDGKEIIEVSFGFSSSAARTLLNCLITIEPPIFDNIRLSTYKKKDSKYINLFVEQNNQKVNWKYESKDVPPIETETLKSGKEVTDSTNRDRFWQEHYESIRLKVNTKKVVYESDEPEYVELEHGTLIDDDVPF